MRWQALREAYNSGKAVKTSVKARDLLNSVGLHDRQMQRISHRNARMPHHDAFRSIRGVQTTGSTWSVTPEKRVECGLNRITPCANQNDSPAGLSLPFESQINSPPIDLPAVRAPMPS